MELTVQNMYGLLLRSKLLSVDEARTLFARWQAEAKDAVNNINRFAAWMVANRFVTEYQASLLVRGHADGFFLGEYKIINRLGTGRMAGVYKCQHRLGQIVAVKVLPPSKARESSLFSRFKREARLLLKLKHPNIVRAFQVGEANRLHFLVMEFLEGETLDEVMQRRRVRFLPGEAVRLIHQALQGLHHIHERGLVHRDLKPANLMLLSAGATPDTTLRSTVKILDIGLGRELFDENVPEKSLDPALTSEGVLLGTPDYMAPEQARDARAADIRADIYSLGCVLYHLLAGQLPFPDTNIISQMIRHATETAKPLKEFNPAVPDGLQQVISRMMAKDPSQRYPTPEQSAQGPLQSFLAAGADVLAVPESDPKMRPYLQWLEAQDKKGDKTLSAGNEPAATIPGVPRTPAERHQKRAEMRASLVAKIKAKMRAKMQAEIARRLSKSSGKEPNPSTVQKKAGSEKKKHHKKKRAKSPPGMPAVGVVPVGGLDVELVTMPSGRSALRPTRRDLVVCALGMLAGALATAASFYLAYRNQ